MNPIYTGTIYIYTIIYKVGVEAWVDLYPSLSALYPVGQRIHTPMWGLKRFLTRSHQHNRGTSFGGAFVREERGKNGGGGGEKPNKRGERERGRTSGFYGLLVISFLEMEQKTNCSKNVTLVFLLRGGVVFTYIGQTALKKHPRLPQTARKLLDHSLLDPEFQEVHATW